MKDADRVVGNAANSMRGGRGSEFEVEADLQRGEVTLKQTGVRLQLIY